MLESMDAGILRSEGVSSSRRMKNPFVWAFPRRLGGLITLEKPCARHIFDLPMQLLPGFREFYPDDCARRNYILATWREVARRYGFVEYDGPVLEPVDLYKKKSGGELVGQLFDFEDKGGRHVAIRPEMTPTLARMIVARERDYKKPLKWFCTPQFFRYEKPQRGRGREFYQLNADIIGEPSFAADAELIAVLIDTLRAFGFGRGGFFHSCQRPRRVGVVCGGGEWMSSACPIFWQSWIKWNAPRRQRSAKNSGNSAYQWRT